MKALFLSLIFLSYFSQIGFGKHRTASTKDSSKQNQFQSDLHFASTRLFSFQTVDMQQKGSLEFRISHRFAPYQTGVKNFWGLDGPANIRLGFDYAISNNLQLASEDLLPASLWMVFSSSRLWIKA